jgi:hypothetical protein
MSHESKLTPPKVLRWVDIWLDLSRLRGKRISHLVAVDAAEVLSLRPIDSFFRCSFTYVVLYA